MKNGIRFLGLVAAIAIIGSGVAQAQNREIFNSWIGKHYSRLDGKIPGRASFSRNSVTYDSSYTERIARYVSSRGSDGMNGPMGVQPSRTEYDDVRVERWVRFFFDANGVITTWESLGWKM